MIILLQKLACVLISLMILWNAWAVSRITRTWMTPAFGLDAPVARFGLQALEHRQPVFDRPGLLFINVVVEPASIAAEAEIPAAAIALQRRFDAVRAFDLEVRVADFERLRARVRSVGVEFFGRWRAFCVGQIDAELEVVGKRIARADRARHRVEAAVKSRAADRRARIGIDAAVLVAPADFRLDRAEIERLQREYAELRRDVLRHERLIANDVEVADQVLNARSALPAAAARLGDFEAAFDRFVEKGCTDGASVVDLAVLIVGESGAEADGVDQIAMRRDFGAQVNAILLQMEANILRLDIRIERVAQRHAVEAVIAAVRHAEIAAGADIGATDCCFPGARGTVGQLAAQIGEVLYFWIAAGGGLCAERRGQDVVAGVEVAGLQIAAIRVEHEVASRHVHAGKARAFVGRRAISALRGEVDRLVRHLARDSTLR